MLVLVLFKGRYVLQPNQVLFEQMYHEVSSPDNLVGNCINGFFCLCPPAGTHTRSKVKRTKAKAPAGPFHHLPPYGVPTLLNLALMGRPRSPLSHLSPFC